MKNSSKSEKIRPDEYRQMREELLSFALLEAEDMPLWRSKCPDSKCPLAKIVRSEPSKREELLEEFSDEQVFELLVKHLSCYEESRSELVEAPR